MKMFLLNIVLAVLWCFTWGSFDFYTLIAGFVLGYLLLGLYSRVMQTQDYGRRAIKLISFLLYFIYILVKANLQIAMAVMRPRMQLAPRFVRYDVSGMSELQITTLANAMTLTPGTLAVDVYPDQRYLYVHCMFAGDREAALRDIHELRNHIMSDLF